MKTWIFSSPQVAPNTWPIINNIPKAIVNLLWQRGFTSLEEVDRFLSPKLKYLSPPQNWYGIPKAVDLLTQAILKKQPILVWGDYDVDGVTGSTVIHDVLSFHNTNVIVHLPDRKKEGYGVNVSTLDQFSHYTPGVLLTVDCGISDIIALTHAKKLGFTVIIADHHLPPEILPPADAICNPKIGDNPYPHLAGVGIAFFIMAGLNSELEKYTGKRMDMREVLDLVALGTLADIAKLTGENRILVKNGLLKIAEAKRPGIAALKTISGFSPRTPLTAHQVVFNLAPRINAAGRLKTPRIAHEMLCTQSTKTAIEYATTLDTINNERRNEENRIVNAALIQAEQELHRQGIVLYGEDWHQGVIGIVASRITELLHRPAIIFCADGNTLKGSGRSVADFDLYSGLCKCADLLLAFGGHKQAAGLKILPQYLEAFRNKFNTVVCEFFENKPIVPYIKIDMELPFSQATNFNFLKSLELLQPFGIGNPEPIFSSLPLQFKQHKLFGSNKEHLLMTVIEKTSGITIQAKGWKLAEQIPPIDADIQIAYTASINKYKGIVSTEITIKDWRILS